MGKNFEKDNKEFRSREEGDGKKSFNYKQQDRNKLYNNQNQFQNRNNSFSKQDLRNPNKHYNNNNKLNEQGFKSKYQKVTNESLMEKYNFDFSRNAEWFKNTVEKISEVKDDLDKKFYNEEKKSHKLDFLNRLKTKLKDYRDAVKYAEKYKKVRFFERRKLERMLVKVDKQIKALPLEEEDKNKLAELNKQRDKVINDINYVKYYPRTYKYYSLMPKEDKDNPETLKKIEKMRRKIEYHLNKSEKTKTKIEKEEEVKEDEEVEIDGKEDEDKMNVDDKENSKKDKKEKIKSSKETTENKPKTKKPKLDPNDYENDVRATRKGDDIKKDDFFIVEDDE